MGFSQGFEKVALNKEAFIAPLARAGMMVARPLMNKVVKPVGGLAMKGVNKAFGGGIGTFMAGVGAVNDYKKYNNQMQSAVSR